MNGIGLRRELERLVAVYLLLTIDKRFKCIHVYSFAVLLCKGLQQVASEGSRVIPSQLLNQTITSNLFDETILLFPNWGGLIHRMEFYFDEFIPATIEV